MSKVISCVEFVSLILARKGCQFIGLNTRTKADLKGGKKCPHVGAMKVNRIAGMVGASYENMKNKELVELGLPADYVVGPRTWGQRIVGTPFIVHTPKGETTRKLYIEFCVKSGELQGYENCKGESLAASELADWLNPPRERSISLCDYSLESIQVVRMGGEEYTLDHSDLADAVAKF